jgi:FMN reductase [NAD(P)H]
VSLYELLKTRRSVRCFEDRPVDDDVLEELFDAVANAPSGGNIQPVSVVVVRDAARRAELADVVGGQPWVRNAPVSLVFCLDFNAVERWAAAQGVRFRGRESRASRT